MLETPKRALCQCTGNGRGRTIRLHIRKWEGVRDWLRMTTGEPYPKRVVHVLDYLEDSLGVKAARSHPAVTAAAAMSFIEKAVGVVDSECGRGS